MILSEWVRLFRGLPEKHIFSASDLSQLTGMRRDVLRVEMARLVKRGVVERLARGWYANPFHPPTAEETAMVLRRPAYISMEYALSFHSILSQTAYTVTVITTKNPYTYSRGKWTFEYHQISRRLFWGFEERGAFNIASPGKALLDLIYIRAVRGRELDADGMNSLLEDMHLDLLDKGALLAHARRFGGWALRFVEGLKI
ncbi:MAG: hypothetical protein AB1665_01050 [Candidatus Thermoplasmatota archaeon]